MKLQQLYSYTRRAIDDYHMIDDNDKIAIGISGGKDSLTLLYALHGLRRFYPKKFDIVAITVDLGLGIQKLDDINKLCKQLDVEYHIVNTEIGNIIFGDRNTIATISAKHSDIHIMTLGSRLNINRPTSFFGRI